MMGAIIQPPSLMISSTINTLAWWCVRGGLVWGLDRHYLADSTIRTLASSFLGRRDEVAAFGWALDNPAPYFSYQT